MSSLDDLRRTLTDHADAVTDDALPLRAASVHGRVRRVRRQRRAGAVAALALVIGAGLGLRALDGPPDSVEPADTVVGIKVPTDLRVDGVRYHLTSTRTVEAGRSIRLPGRSTDSTLTSLVVNGLSTGSATLRTDQDDSARLWSDGVAPATWTSGRSVVRVAATDPDARLGLAVYSETADVGPVVQVGPTAFRRQIGDDTLLSSDATGGDAAPRVILRLPGRSQLDLSVVCRARVDGLWVRYVDGTGATVFSSPCVPMADPERRIVADTGTYGIATGAPQSMRVEVSRGRRGPAITSASEATIAVGVYRNRTEYVDVPGGQVPRYATWGSRRFVFDRIVTGSTATTGLTLQTPAGLDGDRLVGVFSTATSMTAIGVTWRGAGQRGTSSFIGAGPGGSTVGGIVLSGDRTVVRVIDTEQRPAPGAIIVYRPIG